MLELTDLQQAYWLGEVGGFELAKASAHIYQEYAIPDCDPVRLDAAWRSLIARHEALRSRITADGFIEIAEAVPPYAIRVIDLRGEQRADHAASQLAALRQRMTDHGPPSSQWPPFELALSFVDGPRATLHLSISLLVTDGWGLSLLLDELHALYHQPETQLAAAGTLQPYRERINAYRNTDGFQRSLEYWRGRATSLLPAPELPLVQSLDTVTSARASQRSWTLAPADAKAFRARAAKARVTPSSALCAAYADVIGGYSKTKRFTLNQMVSIRPQFEAFDVVDSLTSTLFVEVSTSAKQTFVERARAHLKQTLADLPHALVGGVRVTRELARLHGEASRITAPFVFAGLYDAPTLSHWPKLYDRVQTVHVLLDYSAEQEETGMVHRWEVIDEAFPPGLIDAMFASFCDTVTRLARSDDAWTMRSVQCVPEAQLARRREINATDAPISDELLHTAFLRQAEATPDAPAVITETRTLTYGELARRSAQLARWLHARGTKREERVAILMERGWEQIVAVLGVLQAGAAYVPMDTGFPPDRVAHIVTMTSARVLLTQSHLELALPETGLARLDVDQASDAPAERPQPVQAPDDLAYIIFTSGSTGQPKGVAISHRAAVNTVLDVNRRFDVGPSDRVLALSLLNFDLSVYDIFGMLGAGAAIVIPTPEHARLPDHWRHLVTTHAVTIWNSVPAYMQMMVAVQSDRYPSLRLIMMSGDWIPVDLPAQIRTIVPTAELVSLGGATEAAIWSIIHPIIDVDPTWKSIPYGRPMVNQRWHVLDEDLQPCPDFVPGHLYIAGIGLAMGYWQAEALTAASFITHPTTGERLYRTGDWGRYHPSGDIEFLGREDGQVKVRGFRIELGEIEHVLRQHHAVTEAMVVVQGDAANRQLIAYLITDLAVDAELPSKLDAEYAVHDSRSRAHTRVPFRTRIVLESDGSKFELETLNLSTGGVGYATTSALPAELRPGSPVHIHIPEHQLDAPLVGVVAWCREGTGAIRFSAPRETAVVDDIVRRIIQDNDLSLDHLRTFVKSKLPDYMVPSAFVLMDAFPLSANGKVDRRQLPALDAVGATSRVMHARVFTAPRTGVEQQVATIFEELLHENPISVTDSFFELGGNSLLAVRLMSRLQQAFGVTLALSALLVHPTVESVATLVVDNRIASTSPLVTFRSGTRTPLFCVHPSGGGVLCYQPLARLLDASQGVYGLEAMADDDTATCEDIAARYVAAIREIAPHGPYRLAGWSSGGVVAFEMARQLRADNEPVEQLVLIDSWAPALVGSDVEPSDGDLLLHLVRDLGGAYQGDAAQLRDELKSVAAEDRPARALAWLVNNATPLSLPQVMNLQGIYRRNIRASVRYQPAPLSIATLLLRCRDRTLSEFPDPSVHSCYGWDRVIPRDQLRVEIVPGGHYTVLASPNVDAVAQALSTRPAAADQPADQLAKR